MLTIYKASAGSGKTFTLTYEYIKMLLGVKNKDTKRYSLNRKMRDRHRHILAVTFTNKATDEMKRRIIHELAVLGKLEPGWPDKSPYEEMLCNDLHCSADDLREAAGNALRQLLFDFNFFQVSTIDSFFQTILRTFAREVDISGNYDVDLDNDRAIDYGVHELFDTLKINSGNRKDTAHLINWITEYLDNELSNGRQIMLFNRQSKVHSRFLKFIQDISNDDFAENYDEMKEYLSDISRLDKLSEQLRNHIKNIQESTRQACSRAIDTINARGYNPDPGKKGKEKARTVNANLYKQLADIADKGEETGKRASAAKALADITAAYNAGLKDELEACPDADLERDITDACRAITEGSPMIKLYRTISTNIFVLGLLERVYFHVDQYRNDNNTIYLSDTNTLLRKIIGDDADGAPFVYERVGVWINHYLIDEFQDTSRVQWENLSPLLHQGQSEDDDSLIIGDEKQCIYRFRFSDPELLQSSVSESFADKSETKGSDPAHNTNWRSSRDVINFNNSLFKRLAEVTNFDDIYGNVAQRVSPKHINRHGYIKATEITCKNSNTDEFREATLSTLTDDIIRQLAAGYLPSDIAILTRFNTEGAEVISYLMEKIETVDALKGVRIMSDDAMAIASAPAVRLIISILRYIAMPQSKPEALDQSVSRRSALRREIGRMVNHFDHLVSQGADNNAALQAAIRAVNTDSSDPSRFVPGEKEIASTMACFNLPSLVEHIIFRFLSEEMRKEQNMYISAFVDEVTEFCSRGTTDIHAFLRWWDDVGYKAKISAPFDKNAIRVMSIHKSKGLEFKCVHIPFANWDMIRFKGLEWFPTGGRLPGIDDVNVPPMIPMRPSSALENTQFEEHYLTRCRQQLLDELNVLYVAMTRAEDELSVIYQASEIKDGPKAVNQLLQIGLEATGMVPQEGDDNDLTDVEITTMTIGSPTTPRREDEKPHQALEPTEGESEMETYQTAPRNDLWQTLDTRERPVYSASQQRGILLHDLLAHVHTIRDLDKAVNLFVARGAIPRDEAEAVREHLRSELKRPATAVWFDGFRKAIKERDIMAGSKKIGRPDRVVWTADGHIDIIDYKFGAENNKAYSKQVGEYMDHLRSMGNDAVRGYIWYVDSGKIVKVGE